MKPRKRVLAAIERKPFDRLPIKHLAVTPVDETLYRHFGVQEYDELLDILGHDFREIQSEYRGPEIMGPIDAHGIISGIVWRHAVRRQRPKVKHPLAEVSEISDLDHLSFPEADWYDYSSLHMQCQKYRDYACILGYCELDFINGISALRGNEQVLIDIGSRNPVFLELVRRRFEYTHEHLRRGLEAAQGEIDIVHLGEDLGSQQGLLLSPQSFMGIFGGYYRAVIDLAHRHGAKVMMHVCGSVVGMIPTLIELGLDILDVVQTNAVGMDLAKLKEEYGQQLTFSGTMCVQQVIPFGTVEKVRAEVQKRLDLFGEGGLIIGPSHQLQVDSPLENILEMYRAAGGLRQ